jgi:hypothetical protein
VELSIARTRQSKQIAAKRQCDRPRKTLRFRARPSGNIFNLNLLDHMSKVLAAVKDALMARFAENSVIQMVGVQRKSSANFGMSVTGFGSSDIGVGNG